MFKTMHAANFHAPVLRDMNPVGSFTVFNPHLAVKYLAIFVIIIILCFTLGFFY